MSRLTSSAVLASTLPRSSEALISSPISASVANTSVEYLASAPSAIAAMVLISTGSIKAYERLLPRVETATRNSPDQKAKHYSRQPAERPEAGRKEEILGPHHPLFLQVRILKDFKSNDFVSAHSRRLIELFFCKCAF